MPRPVEFYPDRQARPQARHSVSFETGLTPSEAIIVTLQEENVQLKEIIEKLLNEQIQITTKMLIEMKQLKLLVLGMSGDSIDESDVENNGD